MIDLFGLFLQCNDARQISQVALVNLTRGLVRCRGFGANQSKRSAAAFCHMGEVTVVSVDNLMQVLATVFGEWKAALLLIRIGQEYGQCGQSPQVHDSLAARR